MRQAFKFRIVPSRAVAERLAETLELCRELYNACLTERRAAWLMQGKTLSYYEQSAELPGLKAVCPEYKTIYADTLVDVLRRVQFAYDGFFRRVKAGQKPGFPRYKGRDRYDSFTFKIDQRSPFNWLKADKLTLPKIGSMRVRLSRFVGGRVKTVTIKREGERWFVIFSCELPDAPPTAPAAITSPVGIDLGVEAFLTTSDGRRVENPRHLLRAEDRLKKAQRRLSRKKKGSGRRKRAKARVAALNRKVADQRRDFLHKLSRKLVNRHDLICFENLNIAGMMKNRKLAKHIADAAWSAFIRMLEYKAEWAGTKAMNVAAQYTSQDCSGCGERVPKALSVRWHKCPHCRTELHRDHNAALNILARGIELAQAARHAVSALGGSTLVGPMKSEPLHIESARDADRA
jgi:putative transposase